MDVMPLFLNAFACISATPSPKTISFNGQLENALITESSITFINNVSVCNALQPENAPSPILVTPLGIVIAVNALQSENALSPILVNLLFSANVTFSMDVQPAKAAIPISSQLGMVTLVNGALSSPNILNTSFPILVRFGKSSVVKLVPQHDALPISLTVFGNILTPDA